MSQHPYEKIAESIRRDIRDGVLEPGQQIPSVRALAEEMGVSTATVRHALTWLQNEGYVRTSPRGTFVSDAPTFNSTPWDRLMRLRRTGSVLGNGETVQVLQAGKIRPPQYVADIFDLERGEKVGRREYIVWRGLHRTALVVEWYPGDLVDAVEAVRSKARHGTPVAEIERITGRRAIYGRDAAHAREATQREAAHLGLRVGAPVLGQAHEWSDDQGLIVYAEWVLPTAVVVGYEYGMRDGDQ